jgi:hypothetical protein
MMLAREYFSSACRRAEKLGDAIRFASIRAG